MTTTPHLSSDIVRNVDFAVSQRRRVDAAAAAERWDDGMIDREVSRYVEAFDLVVARPSASLDEIKAKARLSLSELVGACELENANPGLRLAADVLQEIISLRG